jgi:hypothetical protein
MTVKWVKVKCCFYCRHFHKADWVELEKGGRDECLLGEEDDPEPLMVCEWFQPNLLYETVKTA